MLSGGKFVGWTSGEIIRVEDEWRRIIFMSSLVLPWIWCLGLGCCFVHIHIVNFTNSWACILRLGSCLDSQIKGETKSLIMIVFPWLICITGTKHTIILFVWFTIHQITHIITYGAIGNITGWRLNPYMSLLGICLMYSFIFCLVELEFVRYLDSDSLCCLANVRSTLSLLSQRSTNWCSLAFVSV